MTLYVEPIKRMRIYEEPNGSFAVDHTGTLGDYLDCPFIEGTANLRIERPTESPGHSQQHIDGHPLEVLMPKRAFADFSINLETVDTKSSGSGASVITQGALGRLLKIAMGGEDLGTGTTVNDASATTTQIDLTSAAGFAEGGAIGLNTGTGNALEIREIENISSNTIDLKHATSNAVADSQDVAASATYSMDSTDGSETTSLQLLLEGAYTEDSWYLAGGWLASPFTLELTPGQIPRVNFSWQFAQWFLADGSNTSGDLTAAAAATATYADAKTLVHVASEFREQTVGTATIGNLVHASQIEFVPQMQYVPQISSAGTNNVVQSVRVRNAPVIRGSFVTPYEGSTWFDARDNQTRKDLMLQIGTSVTDGGILITAPNTQITGVERIDDNGIMSQRVSWVGGLDTDVNESTATDLGQSAFRIHLI